MNAEIMNITNRDEQEQTLPQSVLISLALVYLAIPNVLFLWGWYTPRVALAATSVIMVLLLRAVWISLSGSCGMRLPSAGQALSMGGGLFIAVVVCMVLILHRGILGFVPSHNDLYVLRNAMFANLRDAPWPLILPNGKEMSYYLANVLPPAILARSFPSSGQWAVVLWTLLAMMLSLLMVSSRWGASRRSWGARLAITALFMGGCFLPLNVLSRFVAICTGKLTGLSIPCAPMVGGVLGGCGWAYNTYAPILVVAAMLLVCRKRAESVLPLALAMLVPLSPLGGIGLLPLVVLRWWQSCNKRPIKLVWLVLDSFVPLLIAFLSAVYFMRADGDCAVTMSFIAWGWKRFLHNEMWVCIGWLSLFLPLCFSGKKDMFFYTLLGCSLLIPCFYIGSLPSAEFPGYNELNLKTSPGYMLLVGYYWMKEWSSIGWYKYGFVAACSLFLLQDRLLPVYRLWGVNAYLQVDDRWNGHLNHDAPFLNQSVPLCKEPMVPGILLRETGESENFFPGNLLPKAPGCDYSSPARPEKTITILQASKNK